MTIIVWVESAGGRRLPPPKSVMKVSKMRNDKIKLPSELEELMENKLHDIVLEHFYGPPPNIQLVSFKYFLREMVY